jgi:two-component system phosphate regulon sensor histidine kinase PhoR
LPIKLVANKDLLRSAVSNLFDNAIKYSKNVPEISVKLQVISGKILLRVSDKGIGISKADQTLVFEKFYRAYTGNRHDVKGFGLGLSFVKDVVENLNGKVWVESELGKGSSFFIEIPLN